jgi:hypothetical protein
MKEIKSIGVFLAPVLFMSLASVVYAKGGPKNDDPGEALPLPIPTIETGKVQSEGLNQHDGDVRWILPGQRRLDPRVFGTPAAPLGFEPDVGVPLAMRLTSTDGTAYTTTKMPTPFSDNAVIISGQYSLDAVDNTLVDNPASEDMLNYQATVTSPAGGTIEIEVTQILPVGIDHTVFGGVGTNMIHHGMTGIGTKMQPTQPTVAAFWGIGTISVNGVVDPVHGINRLVHSMITCHVRDANYHLVFDDGVDCSRIHTHLMLPNVQITTDGSGNYEENPSPVPTGFSLPNGMEQPFLHVMFENVRVTDIHE